MKFAQSAASEFFRLAIAAAYHGGFLVSAGGGTLNVVAEEIARGTGVRFDDAKVIIEMEGKKFAEKLDPILLYGYDFPLDWYEWLADIQPEWVKNHPGEARFDAQSIARQAVRAARRRIGEKHESISSRSSG
jgi:hypothetical protein